ncbi:MAG: ATP synthase F1 subunit delta [Firmicutes bacterium]|nr:ATP synthase F1 subunit delta [Bacillota bacterium]
MAKVGAIYAKSLFELSKAHDIVDSISKNFDYFVDLYNDNPNIEKYLSNPIFSKDEKKIFIDKIVDDKLLSNFFKVLIDKRRESCILDIYSEYNKLVAADRGELTAIVKTAKKLNDEQIKSILSYLENKFNKKILIDEIIDETIKMGFVIDVEGIEIDATVDSAYNRLKSGLKKIEVKL